jgi:uncharacterized protein
MYNKINITENTLRVLALFTEGYDRDCYIREAAGLLDVSPRTAQLILADLEKRGVLTAETRGKNKSYRLLKNDLSARYLTLTEQYKAVTLMKSNMMIREVCWRLRPCIDGLAIIFGSYAKASATKDSDLDILIVGNADIPEMRQVGRTIGVRLHVLNYTRNTFRSGVRTDLFLQEVLRSHIVFIGSEEFVDVVFDDLQDKKSRGHKL